MNKEDLNKIDKELEALDEVLEAVGLETKNDFDELLDTPIGATVTDGDYEVTLKEVVIMDTEYTSKSTVKAGIVIPGKPMTGRVYKFVWQLKDGRIVQDSRFVRMEETTKERKFLAVNSAISNIATALGKTTMTLREIMETKPTLTIYLRAQYNKETHSYNRNVHYLAPREEMKRVAVGAINTGIESANAPF